MPLTTPRVRSFRNILSALLLSLLNGACDTAANEKELTPGPGSGGGSAGTTAIAGAPASGAGGAAGGSGAGAAGTAGLSGGGAAGASAGSSGGGSGGGQAESSAALEALEAWLATPVDARPELESQPFASVALTKADADEARTLLWNDYGAQIEATRSGEMGADEATAASLTVGGVTLEYYAAVRGTKPASGWSLFISMHGGGGVDPATNDGQWQNQVALVDGYNPTNAIWVAPRAPTDEWNMWFREHMDALFERLITNYIVFEGVDPNRIYLNGYSAGGDGAYQMGPRMADSWAGVGMSAGHPNDASQLSLRNTAFAIHVGGDDTAFDRDALGQAWGEALDALAAADAGGYPHQWQVHEGLPHWMNLEDAVSIPFLQGYERDPIPSKVVWRQAATLRERFYWLKNSAAVAGSELTASYAGSQIELNAVTDVQELTLRLSDAMLDLDQPLTVTLDGSEVFAGVVPRTIAVLQRTLIERGDPALVFPAEIGVQLP